MGSFESQINKDAFSKQIFKPSSCDTMQLVDWETARVNTTHKASKLTNTGLLLCWTSSGLISFALNDGIFGTNWEIT